MTLQEHEFIPYFRRQVGRNPTIVEYAILKFSKDPKALIDDFVRKERQKKILPKLSTRVKALREVRELLPKEVEKRKQQRRKIKLE